MTIHALGPFRLDTRAGLLLHERGPVALGRRAAALLRALVERPGALLSKDALIEAAWPGRLVEESNLTVQIAALRRALAATPGGDRWIETMPGRGYRFVGPVVAEAQKGAPEKSTPPRLSMVVLPFANIGGDLEQEHFVDGVTESLTTDLSRIRGSFVIARNTASLTKASRSTRSRSAAS
jgi:DNA-binding winged helix-turn-helix (wHTH) protein